MVLGEQEKSVIKGREKKGLRNDTITPIDEVLASLVL
jgi:hypothetical protein